MGEKGGTRSRLLAEMKKGGIAVRARLPIFRRNKVTKKGTTRISIYIYEFRRYCNDAEARPKERARPLSVKDQDLDGDKIVVWIERSL